MHLRLLGISHHSAPLELRESLALAGDRLAPLTQQLGTELPAAESLLLATCNRIELYLAARSEAEAHAAEETFFELSRIPQSARPHFYRKRDGETTTHLIRVCAGLDSQIVGEAEVFGQVKAAYATASAQSSAGVVLHRLFQKSFQIAKRARTETGVGRGQVSLGNIGVDLAQRIFGKLPVARTLLIGSGEVGADVAKALCSRGATCLTVSSRKAERAEALARQVNGLVLPFKLWPERLAFFDIVVCCTAAPGYVLSSEQLAGALRKRGGTPLFIIDLAVPRDVDPAAAELPEVYLYNLDDLAQIANENRAQRLSESEACESIILLKAKRLWDELATLEPRTRSTQPSISSSSQSAAEPSVG